MKTALYNQNLENVGNIELDSSVFGLAMNRDLLFQVATSQMSNQRQVIAHAKGRGEVSGGGKKPWKQKGTGRARHGSIRSPIWIGGGVTHGPTKERNFKKKINIKMAKKAVCIALSSKVKEDHLRIMDAIEMASPKTKEMAKFSKGLQGLFGDNNKNKDSSILIIMPKASDNLKFAVRNIPNVDVIEAANLNALMLLSYKYLVIAKDATEMISKTFKV